MRVQVLQHVPFEGVGSMADWFQARGADVRYTCFFEADAQLPEPASCDLIVAMGGPMSVNDEAELPWLIARRRFSVKRSRWVSRCWGYAWGHS